MNIRRNTAAEEFTADCMLLMSGFTLFFVSILSIVCILTPWPPSSTPPLKSQPHAVAKSARSASM
jgi:hypothetical protein